MVRTFINGRPAEIQEGIIDRNWFDKVNEKINKNATLEEENRWLITIIKKFIEKDKEIFKELVLPEHIKEKLGIQNLENNSNDKSKIRR